MNTIKINGKVLAPFMIILSLMSSAVFSNTNKKLITPQAFVYTEVQNSVPFNEVPWKQRNPVISSQPGFMYKTWLSGIGNQSVGGFYAFDSIENAQKYVTEFFPKGAKKQGFGHTTRIFNAPIVADASRNINSVDFDGQILKKPKAFVYTEIQVSIPFSSIPWKKRNPILKKQPGLLAKTWLSGINTNTVGGFYAFDSIESAKYFAFNTFPEAAKKMGASLYIRVFDAGTVEEASQGMNSPFFN